MVPLTGIPKQAAGQKIRGRGAAGDVGGARRVHGGVEPMRATAAKLDHGAALGGSHHARGLAGHRRLERDEAEQRRLDQLRLGGGGGHTHDRLVVEDDLAFLHGPHVAGEPKRRQIRLEEGRRDIGKRAQRAQPRDLVGREVQGRQVLERLLEAGGDQVLPVVG